MRNAFFLTAIVICIVLAQGYAQQAGQQKAKEQTLEQRVAELEKRLRALEYPELRERNELELLALRRIALANWKIASNFRVRHEAGASGRLEWLPRANAEFWSSLATLAYAKNRIGLAAECHLRAMLWSDYEVEIHRRGVETGNAILSDMHRALRQLSDANIAFLRAMRIAESQGQEISSPIDGVTLMKDGAIKIEAPSLGQLLLGRKNRSDGEALVEDLMSVQQAAPGNAPPPPDGTR